VDQSRSDLGVLGGVLIEVVSDAVCRPVDGLVDLKELREAPEVGVPFEQLMEGFMHHGVAQAGHLQLGPDLVIDLFAGQRQRERLVQGLPLIESLDDLSGQLTHRLGHASPLVWLVMKHIPVRIVISDIKSTTVAVDTG
jgi:hypothetical protein